MNQYNKIVVISDINSDITDILIQRVVYRMSRSIHNDLTILIDDTNKIDDKSLKILNQLNTPFMIVSNINETPFKNLYEFKFPKFSEHPYSYVVVDNLVAKKIKKYNLVMDRNLNLIDNHIHTHLAYCGENMNVEKTIELAKLFGLKGIRITEHADQLYLNSKNYKDVECYSKGIKYSQEEDYRISEYMEYKEKFTDSYAEFGVEVGIDFNGELIIKEDDLKHFDYKLGAMHMLKEITPEEFLKVIKKLLTHNIDVIAHPFRIFKRNGKRVPTELFKPVAILLKEYKTAAEINFHSNNPPVEFIKECLKQGVKLSFGSDSHNLAEIGDFSYHLDLLKEAGFRGELTDILWGTN